METLNLKDENIEIISASDIANLFMDEYRKEKTEVVKVVVLDEKNIVQEIVTMSSTGNNESTTVSAKEILSIPINLSAPKFILVHNHPSGNSAPSKKDIESSKMLYKAAKKLGLEMLDHVVIGDGNYASALRLEDEEV